LPIGASPRVAMAVACQAREEGYGIREDDERLTELIRLAMWTPRYYPYRFASAAGRGVVDTCENQSK
jgi:hypothetical protein